MAQATFSHATYNFLTPCIQPSDTLQTTFRHATYNLLTLYIQETRYATYNFLTPYIQPSDTLQSTFLHATYNLLTLYIQPFDTLGPWGASAWDLGVCRILKKNAPLAEVNNQ